jgi:hypothetical protein
MLIGKKEYGAWKDGSSIYKDSKGYYIVAAFPMRKQYLKNWKPDSDEPQLCLINNRWTICKKKGKKSKNKTRRSKKEFI